MPSFRIRGMASQLLSPSPHDDHARSISSSNSREKRARWRTRRGTRMKGRTTITRRRFLGGSAAALLLAGMPKGWVGGAWADEGPESPDVRVGMIALTDCSSIVMAHEL